MVYAMQGSAATIDEAVAASKLAADGGTAADESSQSNRAIGSVVFADLRRFVTEHTVDADRGFVNLVVLQHIVSPALALFLYGSTTAPVVGYGLSPTFLTEIAGDDPSEALREMLGLEEHFTPVLFLGYSELSASDLNADNVLGHEMGHALGLQHSNQSGDVMSPGTLRGCTESFNAEQLDAMSPEIAPPADGPAQMTTEQSLARLLTAIGERQRPDEH
jgi:hypothetical protein